MGFGGGAMIASPLSVALMNVVKSATSMGVVETFVTMGLVYFAFMMFGAFSVRVPPAGWQPEGWTPGPERALVTTSNVEVNEAMRTPQFWLLWVILCMNVTAGIGILEQASPMIQEIFKPQVLAPAAAGFVSLLSLSNMLGRFFWSSLSDRIGRRATYFIFFGLGALLYGSIPTVAATQSVPIFVLVCVLVLSMYGGGFATIPAYLRDLFGTMQVGAIHGRLLTAWSTAGVLGPVLVNYIREYQEAHGVPPAQAYNVTMYVMTALLLVGAAANLMVRPVDARHYFHGSLDAGGKNG
jgi:MFS family permease